jgi:hypothetical protein
MGWRWPDIIAGAIIATVNLAQDAFVRSQNVICGYLAECQFDESVEEKCKIEANHQAR